MSGTSQTISSNTTVTSPVLVLSGASLVVDGGVTLDAPSSNAVAAATSSTVTNSGTIISAGYFAVQAPGPQGGTNNPLSTTGSFSTYLTNTAHALITDNHQSGDGVLLDQGRQSAFIVNDGTISATAHYSNGVYFGGVLNNQVNGVISAPVGLAVKTATYPSILENSGTIEGSSGVNIRAGGIVENNASGTIEGGYGLVLGGWGGVNNPNQNSLVNSGTILGSNHYYSAVSVSQGNLTNNQGALIKGGTGVNFQESFVKTQTVSSSGSLVTTNTALDGTLTNAGVITGTSGSGIYLSNPPGGFGLTYKEAIDNQASGVVSGTNYGIQINGSIDTVLTNAGTISGAAVVDFGPGTASQTLVNSGLIESTGSAGIAILVGGGSVDLNNQGGTLVGRIVVDQGTELTLSSALPAGENIYLAGSLATIALADPQQFAATIDQIEPKDTIDFTTIAYNAADHVTLASGNVLELTNSTGTLASVQLNPLTNYSNVQFSTSNSGGNEAIAVPCFARGTRIRTLRGEIAVEALEVDDRVVVLGGGVRPVRWIGRRRIDISRHPRPETVRPVRILAEAFGPGLPARDLVVSPGHALFVAGALIPAEYLVNGATIIREHVDQVVYFHVELDHHAVLFSENLPTESYLDRGNRAAFENSAGVVALHPDFTAHDGAGACLPLVLAGEKLAAARRRLLGRVPALGFAVDEDPDLHLRRDGRRIEAVRREAGWHDFLLPAATREVRLVSHVAVPAAVRHSPDWRTLGVRIDAVFLNERFVPLESPIFRAGFHGIERAGDRAWRWSDGHGILALPPSPTPTALRLKIGESLPHWQNPATARRAISTRTGRA